MAQYVPHYEDWQTVEKWRKAAGVAFYMGVFLSLLIAIKDYAVFDQVKAEYPLLMQKLIWLLNALTFISLIAYPVIDAYVEYDLSPAAEEKRKADFLDNAFGTHFINRNSIGYYTNEGISPGLYKAAVNLFENSFFTYRVTKAMTFRKLLPLLTVLVVVLVLAVFGWGNQPLALPMLQLLFSSVIALDFLKFWLLRNKVKSIYEGWSNLFRISTISQTSSDQAPEILRYWIMYETTLSRLQMGLDSKVFEQLNPELSQEWGVIKRNLNIN